MKPQGTSALRSHCTMRPYFRALHEHAPLEYVMRNRFSTYTSSPPGRPRRQSRVPMIRVAVEMASISLESSSFRTSVNVSGAGPALARRSGPWPGLSRPRRTARPAAPHGPWPARKYALLRGRETDHRHADIAIGVCERRSAGKPMTVAAAAVDFRKCGERTRRLHERRGVAEEQPRRRGIAWPDVRAGRWKRQCKRSSTETKPSPSRFTPGNVLLLT